MNRRNPLKTGHSLILLTVVVTLAAGIFSNSAQICWADTTTRFLVMPFTIHSADNLDYLQRGINDMLTSRLEREKMVVVVTAEGKKGDVAALARKTKADYVISGSVTMLGGGVSTDAQVVKGDALEVPVLSFGRTGNQPADVIAHVNTLATQIKTELLGRGPARIDQPTALAAPAAAPLTTGGQAMGQTTVPAPAPPVPPKLQQTSSGQDEASLDPVRLPGIGLIKGQLNGLAAGDVDGDGIADLACITADHLFVYRINQGQWIKLAEYEGIRNFIGVDTADLNRNGREEIFVTRFSRSDGQVLSFVLEWDGKALQPIASGLPWFFRAVDLSQRGRTLLGQRLDRLDSAKHFAPGIYAIQWTGSTYAQGERLGLPNALNIFGFAQGAVRASGKAEVVTYDSDGYVQILSPSGEENWVSTDRYGGASNFIVLRDESQYDVEDYIYLSPRVHLHDTDGDGVQEILVVNNQASFPGSGVLERHRFYAKGRLEWLKWRGTGIRSIQQSMDVARFISDFALLDIDGDGRLEAVGAVVKGKPGLTSKGSSYLASFNFGSP